MPVTGPTFAIWAPPPGTPAARDHWDHAHATLALLAGEEAAERALADAGYMPPAHYAARQRERGDDDAHR